MRALILALLLCLIASPALAQGPPKGPSCESQVGVVSGYRAMLMRAYEHDLAAMTDEIAKLRAELAELKKTAKPSVPPKPKEK